MRSSQKKIEYLDPAGDAAIGVSPDLGDATKNTEPGLSLWRRPTEFRVLEENVR
jgi:hypothetical protein